jgi:hypothetical protein
MSNNGLHAGPLRDALGGVNPRRTAKTAMKIVNALSGWRSTASRAETLLAVAAVFLILADGGGIPVQDILTFAENGMRRGGDFGRHPEFRAVEQFIEHELQ